jgi:glycosyltransferase involved in cell wall biosynthesis
VKVSGFTMVRNAIKYGYPVEESLRSLLPLVDDLVVAVGDSEDATWDVVTGIGDPKIMPFRTGWDMSKREGGIVLSEQTNLALERCSGDWAVYLQCDELLHENEIAPLRRKLEDHLMQDTEGLSFKYLHFYGSYGTIQDNWCRWYRREVRAVKTGLGIVSVGDAAGFKLKQGNRLLRLIRADAGAHVYHYGWVRPPSVMVEKRKHVNTFYQGDGPSAAVPEVERIEPTQPFRHLGDLRRFTGSHPALMRTLLARQDWKFDSRIDRQPPALVRYLRMLLSCPRDAMRILVSRLLLTWNTYVRAPKLR